MTNQIFPAKLVTAEEIGEILRIIKEKRNVKSHAGFYEFFIGDRPSQAERISLKTFSEVIRKRGDGGKEAKLPVLEPSDVEVFFKFFNRTMNEADWSGLVASNEALAKRLTAPSLKLPNALSSWLGSYLQNSREIQNRTDKSGIFLIIRLDRVGGLILSRMEISSANVTSPIPSFSTSRTDGKGQDRRVEGVLFDSAGLFYSFGKSSLRGGFRATILRPINRSDKDGNERYDMIGARLGQQDDPELPYAYPIYCYQVKKPRTEAEMNQLIGKKELDDELLLREISGLEDIIQQLKRAASDEFGVFASLVDESTS